MKTVNTPKSYQPDIVSQITLAMRTMGVMPIPRNYALFYEAFLGSNPALTREFASLGNQTTQAELDELNTKHFNIQDTQLIQTANDRIRNELVDLISVLSTEMESLAKYKAVLSQAQTAIDDKNNSSIRIIRTAINVLSEATGSKIRETEKTTNNIDNHAVEMQEVKKELDEYKRIANTDSLTRLANRRAFDNRLSSIYESSIGLHLTTLILLDIDHFKNINDNYGHPVGDKVLASVAQIIRACVRKDGLVARSGGEEFAIILDGNNAEEVQLLCERIRTQIAETPFKNSKTGADYGTITISLGYSMASRADTPEHLYAQADIALYHAKEMGRNQTVLYEEGMQKKYAGKGWMIYKK